MGITNRQTNQTQSPIIMNAKLFVFALVAAEIMAKKKCPPCKAPKMKKPNCNKSIGGHSDPKSDSFGNTREQFAEFENDNLQVTFEGTFDCAPCDCKNCEDNNNLNAAAEVDRSVDTLQVFGSGGGEEEEIDDEEEEETVEIDVTSISNDCANFDCPNPPCQIICELEHGYYPDSRDCRNFCFCSGNVHVPSKFQRCSGGLVWDPACGEG